jgi:hypothetical protein
MSFLDKMNKKGTHVGVILSFLIFVTFLAFLYSITAPATTIERGKLDSLNYIKGELLNEFTEDLTSITLKISSSKCLSFNEFDSELANWGIVAKNEDGEIIPSHKDGSKTEVDFDEEGTMMLYYSKEFGEGTDLDPCDNAVEGTDYEILIFRTTENIFGKRIENISDYINENADNYEEMKERLKVPFGDEFGYNFKDSEGNVLASANDREVSVDIYAEEVPIQYLDNEANINPGFLSVRVW